MNTFVLEGLIQQKSLVRLKLILITANLALIISGIYSYTEGRWSKARIVKKEDANNEYDEAKELGTTSGLVFHSKVRDAYGFEVAVYMESNEKATVVLTFEQLLSPINDQYSWTFFLILREDIPELTMNVNIKEEGNVKNIQPSIQHVNDVTKNKPIGMLSSNLNS